ncbi:dihydrofolate reductase family protein [Rhodococcus sp. BP-349]|nr:dihydrofolate reductase family protein [Rhodococcus sp. BP-363]MBY6544668.1 dihydrofolate reductase family protein [Rhodococcus sp. BP-369]MBY6563898.1 dihydrofolate reductase family protein [Rhodococcus sp. BP-370]MBY6579165.1 dihydrofolate reductase family protein [Rhodococcus sp. BP-364]MBY6588466.1 dihydrofolate reductase family protein [Rhodococcus sp. BP-358]MBY6592803.1 dihydrofolate reductase family protein [Rhodococcus sp. BP-362]MBY6596165.1 dihydrofolate reductase family protein
MTFDVCVGRSVRGPTSAHGERRSAHAHVDRHRVRLARLVTGDAVAEIVRLKAGDGGPMDIGGATLAAAAMRAGLIAEYVIMTHPVLVGAGTPFFTVLDEWAGLELAETRTFSGGLRLTRYLTRQGAGDSR